MNALREILGFTPESVWDAITYREQYADRGYAQQPALTHAFQHSFFGWEAYGAVPLLLRYLNNTPACARREIIPTNDDHCDTLLAFLLLWLEEEDV